MSSARSVRLKQLLTNIKLFQWLVNKKYLMQQTNRNKLTLQKNVADRLNKNLKYLKKSRKPTK